MASWTDICSLVLTTFLFVGTIFGIIYVVKSISTYFKNMKASLEARGCTISRGGVSIKTQKRFDREDYLDATQRGLVKAFGAATVGVESHQHGILPQGSRGCHGHCKEKNT